MDVEVLKSHIRKSTGFTLKEDPITKYEKIIAKYRVLLPDFDVGEGTIYILENRLYVESKVFSLSISYHSIEDLEMEEKGFGLYWKIDDRYDISTYMQVLDSKDGIPVSVHEVVDLIDDKLDLMNDKLDVW